MSKVSRRVLLAASAGAMAMRPMLVHAAGRAVTDTSDDGCDLIVTGGRLLTQDPSQPIAEALAVRGNHILAVGSSEFVSQFSGRRTAHIDARGQTLTPGFIDAHSHPLLFSEATGVNVGFPRIADVQAALARKAASTPANQWVIGIMYDDTKFQDGRALTRRDIDAAVASHPVIVRHRGGHTAVVNSRAFALAGIDVDTPDPPGGKYYREAGELTGKVAELAIDPLLKVGVWPSEDRSTRRQAAILISRRMAAAGLTSTTDAWGERENFIAYQDARSTGELCFRLSFMPGGDSDVYRGLKAAGMHSGFGDEMIRIGAVKYAADGSVSERTMRMSTAYAGRPDDLGILTMDQQQIDAAVADALAHGFRIGIHANGDVAIGMVLDSYERALQGWQGPNPRLRIEHCSLINASLLARIKAAGVIPTPFYTYAHYHGEKWPEYGQEKLDRMFAHRSFLDAGIPVAPASDYTPGPFEPLMAIHSMVTRKDTAGRVWGEGQRVSVDEALRICTINGAYASIEEHLKGSLTPGKLADFVILERDPHDVEPDQIVDIRVLRTVLGGRTVHAA